MTSRKSGSSCARRARMRLMTSSAIRRLFDMSAQVDAQSQDERKRQPDQPKRLEIDPLFGRVGIGHIEIGGAEHCKEAGPEPEQAIPYSRRQDQLRTEQ